MNNNAATSYLSIPMPPQYQYPFLSSPTFYLAQVSIGSGPMQYLQTGVGEQTGSVVVVFCFVTVAVMILAGPCPRGGPVVTASAQPWQSTFDCLVSVVL